MTYPDNAAYPLPVAFRYERCAACKGRGFHVNNRPGITAPRPPLLPCDACDGRGVFVHRDRRLGIG